MTNSVARIHCVNSKCKVLNAFKNQVCYKCKTPLVKRYLWSLSDYVPLNEEKTLIGDHEVALRDRYLWQKNKVWLDTKPGETPDIPKDIHDEVVCYLKLFPYRIYVPQIYGYIPEKKPIYLLEYTSIPLNEEGELINPKLFPRLDEVWAESSALNQLNLLYQILQLWSPLAEEKVVSTLLNQDLLRVNDSVIQLLELQPDLDDDPSLKHLGQLWLNWSENCHKSIVEIVEKIGSILQQGLATETKEISAILDKAISKLAQEQFTRKYQIITITDPGGKRGNNEDSCYPLPEQIKTCTNKIDSLTIVCDGLGGQQGGEIASKLAINILEKELTSSYEKISSPEEEEIEYDFLSDVEKIDNAIRKANNVITRRNNVEKRKDRARMGTTVVMSIAADHQMYFAHVGDSRIYWITRNNCRQITMDDDLASREVRLGYAFYRDIIQYSQTGALLQALGMEDSQRLHTNIQKLLLDQDCVFLLCSDGLSDFDRVEQYWRTEILPILDQKIDLLQAAKNLLQVAIKKNGHDNITIGLVYCQVTPNENENETILSLDEFKTDFANLSTVSVTENTLNPLPQKSSSNRFLLILISIIVILGLGIFFLSQHPSFKNYFSPNQDQSS